MPQLTRHTHQQSLFCSIARSLTHNSFDQLRIAFHTHAHTIHTNKHTQTHANTYKHIQTHTQTHARIHTFIHSIYSFIFTFNRLCDAAADRKGSQECCAT